MKQIKQTSNHKHNTITIAVTVTNTHKLNINGQCLKYQFKLLSHVCWFQQLILFFVLKTNTCKHYKNSAFRQNAKIKNQIKSKYKANKNRFTNGLKQNNPSMQPKMYIDKAKHNSLVKTTLLQANT